MRNIVHDLFYECDVAPILRAVGLRDSEVLVVAGVRQSQWTGLPDGFLVPVCVVAIVVVYVKERDTHTYKSHARARRWCFKVAVRLPPRSRGPRSAV